MYNLDKKAGNTGLLGRYFWRVETSHGKGALEKCFTWASLQEDVNFIFWYYLHVRSDRRMACPCTVWQAFLDRGRYFWNWRHFSWPNLCFRSRRFKIFVDDKGLVVFKVLQLCCYSTKSEDFGALNIGAPDGSHITVEPYYLSNGVEERYNDLEAYNLCCVHTPFCDLFYLYRPPDDCRLYRPPPRRKFCDCISLCLLRRQDIPQESFTEVTIIFFPFALFSISVSAGCQCCKFELSPGHDHGLMWVLHVFV